MRPIRLLKDRRQEAVVDADDLARQVRGPAVPAAGVVGRPSAGGGPVVVVLLLLLGGAGPVRELHDHLVDAGGDLARVDRAGPGPQGWDVQLQGPGGQGGALLLLRRRRGGGRGRGRKTCLGRAVAVGESGAGFHRRCQDGFPSPENVVLLGVSQGVSDRVGGVSLGNFSYQRGLE